jgi:hypothetical protein
MVVRSSCPPINPAAASSSLVRKVVSCLFIGPPFSLNPSNLLADP